MDRPTITSWGRRLLRLISLLGGMSFGASLTAQSDPVRVVSCLPHDAMLTVERHVVRALGDSVHVTFENIDVAELVARYPAGLDVDVLCGVDAQLCEIVAADDRLTAHADLPPSFCTDPNGRYFAPWAVGWVLVTRGADAVPGSLDELVSPGFHHLVYGVCGPRAAPSLWATWLRQLAASGRDEAATFAWLTSWDARVTTYRPSLATLEFGFESGAERAVWLPTDRAAALLASGNIEGLRIDVLREGTPLTPLALALVAASPRAAAAAAVFEALRDEALDAELAAQHGLWTSEVGSRGAPHDAWCQSAFPYAPIDAATCRQIFGRWQTSVRGRGEFAEQLEFGLGVGFTLLFLVVVWWMYRRFEREEAADGRTL